MPGETGSPDVLYLVVLTQVRTQKRCARLLEVL
jgi:hypothetical protein